MTFFLLIVTALFASLAFVGYQAGFKPYLIIICGILALAGTFGLGVKLDEENAKNEIRYNSKCQFCKEIKGCDTKIYCNNY